MFFLRTKVCRVNSKKSGFIKAVKIESNFTSVPSEFQQNTPFQSQHLRATTPCCQGRLMLHAVSSAYEHDCLTQRAEKMTGQTIQHCTNFLWYNSLVQLRSSNWYCGVYNGFLIGRRLQNFIKCRVHYTMHWFISKAALRLNWYLIRCNVHLSLNGYNPYHSHVAWRSSLWIHGLSNSCTNQDKTVLLRVNNFKKGMNPSIILPG